MNGLLNHPLLGKHYAGAVVGAAGLAVLGTALAMQVFLNVTPCPLCILQRYCLIAVVLASLLSGAFKGRTSVGLLTLAGVAALGGIAFATRQVYLQSMPETGTACGPGFEYIVNSFPLTDMLPLLFRGTGDCAHVDWIWHGVTIPKLSLFAFVGFAFLLGLVLGARSRK